MPEQTHSFRNIFNILNQKIRQLKKNPRIFPVKMSQETPKWIEIFKIIKIASLLRVREQIKIYKNPLQRVKIVESPKISSKNDKQRKSLKIQTFV